MQTSRWQKSRRVCHHHKPNLFDGVECKGPPDQGVKFHGKNAHTAFKLRSHSKPACPHYPFKFWDMHHVCQILRHASMHKHTLSASNGNMKFEQSNCEPWGTLECHISVPEDPCSQIGFYDVLLEVFDEPHISLAIGVNSDHGVWCIWADLSHCMLMYDRQLTKEPYEQI